MASEFEIKQYKRKVLPTSSQSRPNSIYWIKADTDSEIKAYITDQNGIPYSLKDIFNGGVQTITNLDGSITVVGSTSIIVKISDAIQALINGALQENKIVVSEQPLGDINGINAIFTTSNNLIPNSEKIYVNGNRQKKPDDYNIAGQTVTFTFSPQSTETILIDYIKT